MAFQRSYSKVWWGSDNQAPQAAAAKVSGAFGGIGAGTSFTSGGYYASYFSQQQTQSQPQQQQQSFGGATYHSLDYGHHKTYGGNLSRIQEVDDEQNLSKVSWGKRDSPGSLRSQDSGFSDNDESHSTRSLGGGARRSSLAASAGSSPGSKSQSSCASDSLASPVSTRSAAATPPTVIRRVGRSDFYSPLVNVTRRISFTGSPSTKAAGGGDETKSSNNSAELEDGARLMAQLDELQLVATPGADENAARLPQSPQPQQRRRRRVSRKVTKPLTPTKRRTLATGGQSSGEEGASDKAVAAAKAVPDYNNETVYLGEAPPPPPYNNETVLLGAGEEGDSLLSPLSRNSHEQRYTASTSTPKTSPSATSYDNQPRPHFSATLYDNPLLNGHAPALQSWLNDLRPTTDHEVMSTLQTKSIAQEAFKSLTITTNTVAKLIRQLQQRALYMQSDFERIERLLAGSDADSGATLYETLAGAEQLVANIAEFTKVLERRAVFFAESRTVRKRFEATIAQIRCVTRDTRYSLERQHYISLASLLDDVQVLKRHVLIAIRLVFEKMVRVIVQAVEQGSCDLMLRANINMIATLTNIDYEGFASLSDAFVQCEAVRALLVVCLESRISSVRAQALRALATICCAPAAIEQLGACDGVEIVRDILQVGAAEMVKRGDMERREAVSLLTQITAAWHGSEHRVDGLKDCAETIVEGLTQLTARTVCGQTLLLCAAALNNLSRMEVTSHYSIMSNEAIFRLIEAVQRRTETVSIFLYEQIVAMLHNMSLNKKCHSHLANGTIINFITSAFETEFYKSFSSRAESDAQRRTIRTILHTLNRLVRDSLLGVELLEQQHQRIPAGLFQLATSAGAGPAAAYAGDRSYDDVSLLARRLMTAQRHEQRAENALDATLQEQQQQQQPQPQQQQQRRGSDANETCDQKSVSSLKFNLTRQESFV